MIITTTMMKVIAGTLRIVLLLFFFLRNPCDARQVERGRERGFRTRSLKEEKSCEERKRGSKGKDKGKGKAGGKEGKASTCSPNAYPSFSPRTSLSRGVTPSGSPSNDPSVAPSTKPSSSPSFSPSATPSKIPSNDPSASPSTKPSSIPSLTPSVTPSTSPSKDPSVTPSSKPSSVPSLLPSANPSTSPSNSPSNDPSNHPSVPPSTKPSSLPSFSPSLTPSESPSKNPSTKPSIEPTLNPTVSAFPTQTMNPTVAIFETISSGSEVQTTCISPEPSGVVGGNLNENQLLVFEYLLFIPSTVLENNEKDNIVTVMEDRIHKGLVENFLTCNVDQDENLFHVWSISPNPPDKISSNSCDSRLVQELNPTPPNGSKCLVVQAELNMQVYFPPIRRHRYLNSNTRRILQPVSITSAEYQVMVESGDYLIKAMSEGAFNDGNKILQTWFLAFITEEEGHTTIDGGQLYVSGAEGQLMAQQQKSRVVGGAMTMAAAASCLVVVAFLILRRRKQRSDAFLRHIDRISTFSEFEKDDSDPGTEIVGDLDSSSLGWFSEDLRNEERGDTNNAISLDCRQDVHKCTSAFCQICLKQQTPTFIASSSLNVPDILEDLRSGCSIVDDRSHSSPNTVIL